MIKARYFLLCALLFTPLIVAADDSSLVNTIRWKTASEVENFGYDVYRADEESGPFTRITELPIPGHGTTDVPQGYEYRDESIAPGKVYYYYVESISMSGKRERFTPVYRSKPKTAE